MKILFISDIHANYEALKSLEKYIDLCDYTICLGDILGYHCQVNEVIDFIKRKHIKCILGNHDRYIIQEFDSKEKMLNESVRFGIEYAQKHISKSNLEWLKSLPNSFSGNYDNYSIMVCHGSPWNVTDEYIYGDSKKIEKLSEFNYDIIAMGHTHRAFEQWISKNQLVLNPGSVGQSRDKVRKACAKIFDTNTANIENLEIEYEYNKVIELSLQNGAQEWIYKHF